MQDCGELAYFWPMNSIQVLDRTFVPFISAGDIAKRIRQIGQEINQSYKDKNPLFIGILNGSFIFAADLYREMEMPCEITFMRVSSYTGTSSTGKVKELLGLGNSVKGRHLIVIEDIVDTGLTLQFILNELQLQEPASIATVTLLFKPDALKVDIKPDFCGFVTEPRFLLGYGLDYDGYGRNLKGIFVEEEKN